MRLMASLVTGALLGIATPVLAQSGGRIPGKVIDEQGRPVAGAAVEVDSAPRFASAIELISLNVTVTDQSRECLTGSPAYWSAGWDGCPVNDLAQDAFRISEDGVPQTIMSSG